MKTKQVWMTALAALFSAAFMGGCKDENVGIVGVCPVVQSTSPTLSAIDVPLDRVVTITFNESMNPATISPASFTLMAPDKTPIAGSLTYNALNATMSFTPGALLDPNTNYTGTVATSVKDLMGNALQTPYVWTFRTGTTLSPTVLSTDPANLATGVFLNKKIGATFSLPMDPLTLTGATFLIKQGTTAIAGTVSYNGNQAFFAPTTAFSPSTLYSGTLTTGAKDKSGVSLIKDYQWSFTTGTISAPKVTVSDPADLATGIALNKTLTVTFSEAMNPSSINLQSFTLMGGPTQISGVVSYSGTNATFDPNQNLLSSTTYTATITTEATNMAGTPIANDYTWTFTTAATLGPLFVNLKSVARFGIIAGTGVSNNAGFSQIRNLDVGISPGVRTSITGFPPAIMVNGAIYASDDIAPPGVPAMLIQAKQDLTEAYLFAEGANLPAPATVSGDLGGRTLAPGIYKTTSTLLIQSGDLTLDAQGDANAVWIFQIGSDFTTVGGAGGNVILTGGAQAGNVFWQTGSSATIGDGTLFKGNILALTSITMNSGAKAVGRMLARNGAVVLTNTNIIEKP